MSCLNSLAGLTDTASLVMLKEKGNFARLSFNITEFKVMKCLIYYFSPVLGLHLVSFFSKILQLTSIVSKVLKNTYIYAFRLQSSFIAEHVVFD